MKDSGKADGTPAGGAPWANFHWGSRTYVMGILNITPDSFSDGGRFFSTERAVDGALAMEGDGADLIDVGAESTRPGAAEVGSEEEWNRLFRVLPGLLNSVNIPLSVDTYKAEVAELAIRAGVRMVNDVWGLQRDPDMAGLIASTGVGAVLMHNQNGQEYPGPVTEQILCFFDKSLELATTAGIREEQIVLDPGIGFGKSPEQNLQVMSDLAQLKSLGFPLLLGVSRKSVIGRVLDLPADERTEGTIALNVLGIASGVDIIRVHDVQPNLRAARMSDAICRRREDG